MAKKISLSNNIIFYSTYHVTGGLHNFLYKLRHFEEEKEHCN